jgi:agmatine deiminase
MGRKTGESYVVGEMTSPTANGFYMPAEYAAHAGCWMAWPCRQAAFGDHFAGARSAYAEVARTIAHYEPVTMLANPGDEAEAMGQCGPGVRVLTMDLDDSWTRDTGPTFVVDGQGQVAGVDWIFNGWGNVWSDHAHDARQAELILKHLGLSRFEADFVLEGGAIHVDGQGTLMAVAPCLLDPRRNPGLSLADLEKKLSALLGVSRFIWLEYGLENDETAGHVDNVACFVRPGVVMVQTTDDPADANYQGCRENATRLRGALDARGRRLEVIEVNQAGYREGKDGRLALSYINYYLANGAVIMPRFGDPGDGPAFELVSRAFPERRVVQLPVLDVLHGGGGIHCITQQQPAAGLSAP